MKKFGELYITSGTVDDLEKVATFPADIDSFDISPNGREIVFSMKQHIWTANIDGSELKQLTTSRESESDPAWSPDGKHVAFVLGSKAYVVPADGQRVYVDEPNGMPSSAYHFKTTDGWVYIHGKMYWR